MTNDGSRLVVLLSVLQAIRPFGKQCNLKQLLSLHSMPYAYLGDPHQIREGDCGVGCAKPAEPLGFWAFIAKTN